MKVSILIPVYNSERYLKKTIESALAQSWEDKEIIIVDDGSTDNSIAIAKDFEDRGVNVLTQVNAGACSARNKAFRASTGDYIQYLDGDDVLSPDKIKYQMAMVSHTDVDTVFSCPWIHFYQDDEIGRVKPTQRFLDKDWSNPIDWLIASWNGKGMGQTSIWLTPRHIIEKVGGWDERLSINQDGEFFCRILLEASFIKYTDKSVVYYRSGMDGSVSQKKTEKKISDVLLSYKLYAEATLKKHDTEIIRRALAANYLSYIYSYHRQYPQLVTNSWGYLRELHLSKFPLVGGRAFKFASMLIGFNNSIKIKSLLTWR